MAQLTSIGFRSGCTLAKRFLHHTADAHYLRHWKKMNVDFNAITHGKLYQMPRLVTQILQVQSAMKQKGYFSFIHGAPAASKVLTRLYEVAYGKQEKPYFKYLRPLSSRYMVRVESAYAELFMSYSLTSGLEAVSAAYFGFSRHATIFRKVNSCFKSFTADMGVKMTPEFQKKLEDMMLESNRREVGEFYIIGVKEKDVGKYVTDAIPGGVPTGKDVKDVSLFPEKHTDTLGQYQAHLVTMPLCYDTLHPSSAIVMIDPSDLHEVDSFCAGLFFKRIKEIPEYEGLVSESDTDFEKEQLEKKAKIDEEMEQVAAQFAEMLANPDTASPSKFTLDYDDE
ncbi:MAG TPA: hypothetical protein VLG76_06515 [Rhabdochlamydiaceae bacterium]|nr:hypothetical protein [Rhabdochlamydiaceae bacterium]